jgi:TatA/E family protein of Tat protein translocase
MMGSMNLGLPEMIFIFVIALIIFGPKKLPEIGRQVGKALNEFKRASNEFKAQIESEISQLDVDTAKQQIRPPAQPPNGTVASGDVSPVTGLASPPLESNPVAKAPDA